MQKSTHLLLLFLSVIFIFSCKKEEEGYPDMPDAGEIKALTYNVAGLPEGVNPDQHPTKHMHLVSPLLNAYDLVNVQEDFFYHDSLYKYINLPYKSTYFAKPGELGDGLNCVSNIPFVDFTRITWDSCHGFDCFTPKGFTYSRLRFNKDVFVDLYNVHCNAGDDSGDLRARRNNILQLCNYIDLHSAGNAIILMGDFNCRYTRLGDNIREVDSRGLKNVWVELLRSGVLPLHDGNPLSDCSPNATNATCEVVDKIYYRSSSKIMLTPTAYQLDSPLYYDSLGDPLSDHRPMYAKFTYQVVP
ncbi:MAG: endonuclease/exonuclease/phosphatase family protein [Chitinophagales bacterium]